MIKIRDLIALIEGKLEVKHDKNNDGKFDADETIEQDSDCSCKEEIKEVSNKLVGKYLKKASADLADGVKSGNTEKMDKRSAGIEKGMNKLLDKNKVGESKMKNTFKDSGLRGFMKVVKESLNEVGDVKIVPPMQGTEEWDNGDPEDHEDSIYRTTGDLEALGWEQVAIGIYKNPKYPQYAVDDNPGNIGLFALPMTEDNIVATFDNVAALDAWLQANAQPQVAAPQVFPESTKQLAWWRKQLDLIFEKAAKEEDVKEDEDCDDEEKELEEAKKESKNKTKKKGPDDDEEWTDPENIYKSPSMRQSIENDRK